MSGSAEAIVANIVADLSHLKGVRVIAAMSGGVDSSVMAALLRRKTNVKKHEAGSLVFGRR